MNGLSQSGGTCPFTHYRDFSVMPDVREMRMGHRVMERVAQAVHSANRRPQKQGQMLALDLPEYDAKRIGTDMMGGVIRVMGDATDIERLTTDARVIQELTSGRLRDCGLREGNHMFALRRVRRGEKTTEAGAERTRRRFEKRADKHPEGWVVRAHRGKFMMDFLEGASFLNFDDNRRITFVRTPVTETNKFSTYGMTGAV